MSFPCTSHARTTNMHVRHIFCLSRKPRRKAGRDVQVKDAYLCRPHTEHLPATILADKIYLNRVNRDILEDFEIRDGQSHRGAQRNRMLIRYWQEDLSSQWHKSQASRYSTMLDGNVLLRHYEESHLLPSVCDQKLIQQTLFIVYAYFLLSISLKIWIWV